MSQVVGYNMSLGVHGEKMVCADCAAQYSCNSDASPIYEEEAVQFNLGCADCGAYLVDPDTYWNDDFPEECPNCGVNQFFLEVMEDDSVECSRCFWNDLDKNE